MKSEKEINEEIAKLERLILESDSMPVEYRIQLIRRRKTLKWVMEYPEGKVTTK